MVGSQQFYVTRADNIRHSVVSARGGIWEENLSFLPPDNNFERKVLFY